MTRRAAVLPAVLVLVAALSGGCGGSDEPETAPSSQPTPTRASAAPTPAPAPTRTPKPTRTPGPPTAAPTSDQVGSGDDTDDDLPATAGGGVCGELGDGEISSLVGTPVRGRGLSGRPGCAFTTPDGRALTVTVVDQSAARAGGIAGAKSEAISGVEGEPEDLTGVGQAAFVVTGTMFGGAETQGAGAVQVGSRIVAVGFIQHLKLTRTQVRAQVVALLEKVADELD